MCPTLLKTDHQLIGQETLLTCRNFHIERRETFLGKMEGNVTLVHLVLANIMRQHESAHLHLISSDHSTIFDGTRVGRQLKMDDQVYGIIPKSVIKQLDQHADADCVLGLIHEPCLVDEGRTAAWLLKRLENVLSLPLANKLAVVLGTC